MPSGIRTHLLAFDGQDIDLLEALHQLFPVTKPLMVELVAMCADPEYHVQSGATWLLKRYMGAGQRLVPKQVGVLADSLGEIGDPLARQHVSQAIGSIAIAEEHGPKYAAFLLRCCEDESPDVRGWGLEGLYRLSLQHENLAGEFIDRLEAARADEAQAVKDRVRHLDVERAR